MSDAPETIWATMAEQGTGSWNSEKSRMQEHMPPNWQTEYTRADISAARITELEAQRDELLEALTLADAALSGANMNMKVVEQKIRAAIAKAKESK